VVARVRDSGYVGVDLFFVLSGWLIAGQIFRAMRRNGRIDVAQFWLRRWLRTLPAYYAVASWLALMAIRNSTPVLPFSILLFAQNYTA